VLGGVDLTFFPGRGSCCELVCLRPASARAPAAQYGLNAKTVRKWRKRTTTADKPMGPKTPKSTVLTPAEEAIVVAFRQKTLLPLDDVLGCLKDAIPNLSRSALHRCLQRHGVSRLPVEETQERRKRFKTSEIDLSNRGDIVIDPFLGFGSTLIAAEKTKRVCRGVELDPLHVDVIVRRYEAATSNAAVLAETGGAFEAVAARRASETATV
jgi:transposase-like protein